MHPSQAPYSLPKPRLFYFEGRWHCVAAGTPKGTSGSTPELAFMRFIFFRFEQTNRLTTSTERLE